MRCPKCGHENTGNFCSNCGALLRREGLNELRPQTEAGAHDAEEAGSFSIDPARTSSGAMRASGMWGRSRRREEPTEEQREEPAAHSENREAPVRAPKETAEKSGSAKSGGGKSEKSGKPDKKNERAEKKAERADLKAEKAEKKEMQLRDARINQQLKEAAEREKALSERLEQLDHQRADGERADRRRLRKERAGSEADTREQESREPVGRSLFGRGQTDRERAERERTERENSDRDRTAGERFDSRSRRDGRSTRTEDSERENAGLGKAAVKGAVSAIVLAARLMQLFCGFLMGYMVWTLAWSFWNHQEGLGLIQSAVDERNYGLILYVGIAGISLFMGVIWCLWILSRKAAGGNIRLKTYDTGRGFLPFLICTAAVFAAGVAAQYLPSVTAPHTSSFAETIKGLSAALEAVNAHRATLLSCSVIGAVVSFVRKLLRV